MSKELLQDIIENFTTEKFVRFFREKNRFFAPRQEELFQYNDENFQHGIKLGEIRFSQDENIFICAFESSKPLSERSGKKAQYEKGKKILKDSQSDAGIFIFHDTDNNFRFSLIYAEYLGVRRRFSYFKRLTFFVSPRLTNKTFLQQIGEWDFSYFESIKEAFAVEPVTRQFYGELQYWYFWAMDKIKFPDDYKYSNDPTKDKEIRNATNLIRLITRIIFIRFLTEKGLIPLELFSREKLGRIVKDFMKGKKASNFYNTILQNLFFGTLNQKMDERKFAQESSFQTNRKEYGVKNLYRYGDKFLISKDGVLELFKDIPFLNGGLFDCLDKENGSGKVIYVDGFSRNPAKQSTISDYLFFQQAEERIDLSNYGLGASRPVRGLIEILNSYNFTIDENTPVDQEIALDPELLGKVFENLLASYNPETATTARKATGSYYTPREIVDYMVGESLFEYLKGKLSEIEEEKIRMLLSYSEEIPEFSAPERQKMISAIDDIKILDPACGSGAFPMGILHKLVYALQKLDPENKYWHELQYQKALKESEEVFKQDDKNERQERLKEINEAFDEGINYPDYARKLYLIENCIYGVDIQPIAIQISKLRFFISLVLDQKVDRGKENLGIRALPNLETKFVSANTLIGLNKPQQLLLRNLEIEKKEKELKELRHKYFTAKTRKEKLQHQKQDKELRQEIAKLFEYDGWNAAVAHQIAAFDLYDQNASADFFDPEWMFGVNNGVDIIIANPPYINIENLDESLKSYIFEHYKTCSGRTDIYIAFIEGMIGLLRDNGHLCFIIPYAFTNQKYGTLLRKLLIDSYFIKEILDTSDYLVFNAAVVRNIVLLVSKAENRGITTINKVACQEDMIGHSFKSFIINQKEFQKLKDYRFETQDVSLSLSVKEKLVAVSTPLQNICFVAYGARINHKEEDIGKEHYIKYEFKNGLKPYIEGKNIAKYYFTQAGWLNYKPKEHYNPMFKELFENDKIVFINVVKDYLRFALDTQNHYNSHTVINCVKWHLLDSVKHVSVRRNINNENIASSKIYDYRFLLGILNSHLINWYFLTFLSEKLHFYPDDAKNLPIIKLNNLVQQKPIINLVNQIITNKHKDHDSEVSHLEKQIDELVYALYGLTPEDIAIVEGKK